MKRIDKKHIVTAIFLIACVLAAKAQVQVTQKLDSLQIRIGEQVTLRLMINLKKGTQAQLPEFKPMQAIVNGVEVVSQQDVDTTTLDNGMVGIGRNYVLTSFDENVYAIPPLPVKVEGKSYHGNTLALKVITVPVDTLHPEKFYPPKDVQNNPFLWSEWSGFFVMSVIVILLLVVVWYLYHRLRQNKPIIAKIRLVRRVPAHEAALHEIEQIKAQHAESQESQKAYYTKLTNTLREYIVKRFGFNAMEMTSAEIIERLRQEDDQKMIDELRHLFLTADLVKFAKYETLINENDKNLVNAINFIDQTKTNEVSREERVTEQLSVSDVKSQRQRLVTKVLIIVAVATCVMLGIYLIYGIIQIIM